MKRGMDSKVLEVKDVYGRTAHIDRESYERGLLQIPLRLPGTGELLSSLPASDRRRKAQGGATTICRDNIPCQHPPFRLYAWVAADGVLCVGCCECGAVLAGEADR